MAQLRLSVPTFQKPHSFSGAEGGRDDFRDGAVDSVQLVKHGKSGQRWVARRCLQAIARYCSPGPTQGSARRKRASRKGASKVNEFHHT